MERVKTGINALDETIQGGLVKGDSTLIMGGPGTGKTTLGLQFIFNGVTLFGDGGLYLTFEEMPDRLYRDALNFGWDLKALEEKDKARVICTSPDLLFKGGIGAVLDEPIKEVNAKRAVVDTLSHLRLFLPESKVRIEAYRLINYLKKKGLTSLLLCETRSEEKGYDVEREFSFLADGVIQLQLRRERGNVFPTITVVKMRGIDFPRQSNTFEIRDRGITVYAKPRLTMAKETSRAKVRTGIPGLDKVLEGGLPGGSSTIVSGPTGTGKTVIGLQFLIEGAKLGEPGVFISYEEPESQLRRIISGLNWDISGYEKKRLLKLDSLYPEDLTPEAHLLRIMRHIEEMKAKRLVFDSVSAMEHMMERDNFLDFSKRLTSILKNSQVTAILNNTSRSIGGMTITETMLSTLADNIIMLRFVEIESSMRKALIIVKVRGSDFDKHITEYAIASKGLEVIGPLEEYEGILTGTPKKTPSERFVDTILKRAREGRE